MGVNTRITLEPRASYGNVATVVVILLGCKPTLEPLGGSYGLVCHVEGLEMKPQSWEVEYKLFSNLHRDPSLPHAILLAFLEAK